MDCAPRCNALQCAASPPTHPPTHVFLLCTPASSRGAAAHLRHREHPGKPGHRAAEGEEPVQLDRHCKGAALLVCGVLTALLLRTVTTRGLGGCRLSPDRGQPVGAPVAGRQGTGGTHRRRRRRAANPPCHDASRGRPGGRDARKWCGSGHPIACCRPATGAWPARVLFGHWRGLCCGLWRVECAVLAVASRHARGENAHQGARRCTAWRTVHHDTRPFAGPWRRSGCGCPSACSLVAVPVGSWRPCPRPRSPARLLATAARPRTDRGGVRDVAWLQS